MSTTIRRVIKGFDWLGAFLTDKGITGTASRALVNHQDKIGRLYGQTKHWTKAIYASRVSAYCYRLQIGAAVLCLGMPSSFAAPTPSGAISVGATYRASTSGTWVATSGTGSANLSGYMAASFTIRRTNEVGTSFEHCSMYPADFQYQTSDGWVGIKIATDVVLGLTGTATGSYYLDSDPIKSTTGTWSDQGVFTVSSPNSYGSTWCGGTFTAIRTYSQKNLSLPATFTGTVFIHAGPNAIPGTYAIPGLTLSRTAVQEWVFPSPTYLLQPGSITIVPSTACTVSLQNPSVNFGVVSQSTSDNQILGFFPSQLNINCDLVIGGTAPMSLSFTGTQGRYTDTLALEGAGGQGALAEIRGISAVGAGYCDNNADSIQFQGQQVSIGNVGVGLTSVPLTWSLCSNGSGEMGVGTAQATATLNWP